MSDIEDPINVGTAFRLMDDSKPRPMAGCPRDREPLMSTFERRGAEFHCLVCGGWFGFLAPTPIDAEANQARHDELRARFDAGERGPSDA